MSKPWGGIGSWAAEAEAEEREQAAAAVATKNNADLQSFPSLKEAVSSKPKKKKIPLSEFMAGGGSGGLTPVEVLQLPTGPQQRSPDEHYSGNRGFSNYGRSSGGPPGRREGDSDSSWGGGRRSYGGFDDDHRGASRRGPDYDLQPSRADEVNDWAAGKKSMPPPSMDSGRTNRYGSLGSGSRADESDSWNFGKKPTAAPPPARSSTFGYGNRDSGTDSDRWSRGGEVRERDNQSSRPRLVLDAPRGDGAVTEAPVAKANKPNPFGAARPREDILAEKGVDWKKIDLEIEAKKSVSSRPTSSQGSRPSSAHSSRSENIGLGQPGPALVTDVGVKLRPKVNPFGDAKPREVVLQEKGKDWRKIDLELERRAIDRPETEEERALKEEIDRLKKEPAKELPSDPSQESAADESSVGNLIQIREKELEALIRELDDKVRFAQKAVERPGSGAGSFSDRPPSQSGSIDDGRSLDFSDRPRSRGNPDVWTGPAEDRRGSFHGARDRGFRGSRDFDRPPSRERW